MAINNEVVSGQYPEGAQFDAYVRSRQRLGTFWYWLFFGATFIGMIALALLLSDVVNRAFGYVAMQATVSPEALVVNYYKAKMLAAQNLVTSEDDEKLVTNVAPREFAIGFFGSGVYQQHAEALKLLAINGVTPSAETVASGEYPLSRPLYVYSAREILQAKPQVAAFLNYYLRNVAASIGSTGYFPISPEDQETALAALALSQGVELENLVAPTSVTGDVTTVGSSTVAPITQLMADGFLATGAIDGTLSVDSIGTDAGIRNFCSNGGADMLNASRWLVAQDVNACRSARRTPLEFMVGLDGIALVTSSKNQFLTDVTKEQLQQIFTTAELWSDVDASWPEKKILHYIPGADSGTLDVFVAQVFGSDPATQPKAVVEEIISANISAGRLRALEADRPLADRSQEELLQLLEAEIVKPRVTKTWMLFDSIFRRESVKAEAEAIPGEVDLAFKSWISWSFITSPQSSNPLKAGISSAILGSLWVTMIAFLVAIPLGTAAAVYLEEYSTGKNRFDQLIETNINNLAGVPSIIYGMLGLAVFVRYLGPITSGVVFGQADPATANGRTILSAGLTLGVLILPLVIINAREAIRAVPRAMREGAYGLGATRWQTVWSHVLPNALPGILTGVILAVSRAFGETAPLIVVGVSTFIVVNPSSVFAKYTTLPAQIFQWTSRPQQEFQHLASAAIIVLLVLLLMLNTTAILLRNRYSKKA